MAAVASSRMTADVLQTAPRISDEVRAQLAQERKRLASDPGRIAVPAEHTVSAKYVYRTKPGTYRRVLHQLPMPPQETEAGDEKRFQFTYRRWKQRVARETWYPDLEADEAAEKLTKLLNDVHDALGDTQIKFTSIPRHQECFFPTNSPVVAGYLDELIKQGRGEFAQVYREHKVRLVVGLGTDKAQAFPNTELGSRAARAYAAEHGFTSIEFVSDDPPKEA